EDNVLKFRSFSGVSGVTITGSGDNTIIISGQTGNFLTGASNIGTGSGLYSGRIDNDLKFRTLVGEGGIGISGDEQHLYITGGGGDVTWVDAPSTKNSPGKMGQIAFDNYYYYVCITGHGTDKDKDLGLTGEWRRTAISEW
ncbi:hypothetical protein CL634_06680, partial [bacterium]|nr:hypothetical protein [bacterium]